MKYVILILSLSLTPSALADITVKLAWDPAIQDDTNQALGGTIERYAIYTCESPIGDNDGKSKGKPEATPVSCEGNTLTRHLTNSLRTDGSGYIQGQPEEPGDACAQDIVLHTEAENFDAGASGVAFFDTTPGDRWNLGYRNDPHDVDLRRRPYNDGPDWVSGDNIAGEWSRFTLDIPEDGDYVPTMHLSNANTDISRVKLVLLESGHEAEFIKPIVATNATNPWDGFVTVTSLTPSLSLTAGRHAVRLEIVHNSSDIDWFELTKPGDIDCNPIPPVVYNLTHVSDSTKGTLYVRVAAITANEDGRSPLSNQLEIPLAEAARRPKAPGNLRRR